jgi:hypothetical protein
MRLVAYGFVICEREMIPRQGQDVPATNHTMMADPTQGIRRYGPKVTLTSIPPVAETQPLSSILLRRLLPSSACNN